VKSLKLNKAIEELKEAQAAVSPMTVPYLISPTIANNIFARQASTSSQGILTTLKAPRNPRPPRGTRENSLSLASVYTDKESDGLPVGFRRERASSTSSTTQSSISSPRPVKPDADDDAVFRFTRRLSSAALALANKGFKMPDSGNDSCGSEQTQESDLDEIPSRAKSQTELYADIMAILMWMKEKQQKDLDRHDLRLEIESQRIATRWATQPPPAMSAAELYDFTQNVLQYGAEHAFKVMQASMASRNCLDAAGLSQDTTPSNSQPLVDFCGQPIRIEEAIHGNCKEFYSATSVYKRPASVFPKTQRPCTISMTREDMYHFLKADEVRYRSEWKNPPLLMLYFNPHGERRRNSSKYPLHDKEAREHAETARLLKQQQEQSAPPQTVYYKASAANVSGFRQPMFDMDPPGRQRLASYQMDVELTQQDAPR
jgi:hypothetical protein